jgi:hypothetical protein
MLIILINYFYHTISSLYGGGSSSIYTIVGCIVLIVLICHTMSQSTFLGLKKTLRSSTLSNRDDFLFIMCLAMSLVSFLLSFSIISPESNFQFSIYSASNHLRIGLKQYCEESMRPGCVTMIDNDFKNHSGKGILWFMLRLFCASASAYIVFAIFMPITRSIRSHLHMNSSLMREHYHNNNNSGNSRYTIYSWFNVLSSVFIVLCYYEPFMIHILNIYDKSIQNVILFLIISTSSLFRFYLLRCYVQSYLFYSMQFAYDDATKEAKKHKQQPSSKQQQQQQQDQQQEQTKQTPSQIRNNILKHKLLTYFKYVLLVALQLIAIPCLQLAYSIVLQVKSGDQQHWLELIRHVVSFLCFWTNLCCAVFNVFGYYWFRSMDKSRKKSSKQHAL